ncbi:MAG TPA: cytochrome P450 [Burkholderiaceae bacterium]|nr:cytochrome P450 [Burkholderiaceae bacterium]
MHIKATGGRHGYPIFIPVVPTPRDRCFLTIIDQLCVRDAAPQESEAAMTDTILEAATEAGSPHSAHFSRLASDIPTWQPRSAEVQRDQIAAYDAMRQRCPVARSDAGYTAVFRHADALTVVNDHATFSSAVSRFPSVPNGMDPPEHTPFRALIEPYFDERHMAEFAPTCHQVARTLVSSTPTNISIEFISEFAQIFALQIQCAWLGWPESLHEPLRQWTLKNHRATLSGDRTEQAAVATEFDDTIRQLLDVRRAAGGTVPEDITAHLMRNESLGRRLNDEEIVSILRNWTVGELGTIAASVGILVHYLAAHASVQSLLRQAPEHLPAAIDEILRIHPPLILNRRITTREVKLGGHLLPRGTRLAVLWASANRDESVFGDPNEFRLDRDASHNLLYGAGIHVCPGAPLARLELHAVMQALLQGTDWIALDPTKPACNAAYPGSGFTSLHIELRKHAPD